jgi:hypothetical protein
MSRASRYSADFRARRGKRPVPNEPSYPARITGSAPTDLGSRAESSLPTKTAATVSTNMERSHGRRYAGVVVGCGGSFGQGRENEQAQLGGRTATNRAQDEKRDRRLGAGSNRFHRAEHRVHRCPHIIRVCRPVAHRCPQPSRPRQCEPDIQVVPSTINACVTTRVVSSSPS